MSKFDFNFSDFNAGGSLGPVTTAKGGDFFNKISKNDQVEIFQFRLR